MIQQFGESLASRWDREHAVRAHKKHLNAISTRSKSTIRSPEQTKIINLRKISQEIDKQREIERENFLLFLKLHSIKERKTSPREFCVPKSLNFSVRKKEAEKIMSENYGFVKRFIEMPSFVSAQKLMKDYEQHQSYKRTISKANLHKRLKNLSFVTKPKDLPPIECDEGAKVRSEGPSKLGNLEKEHREEELDVSQTQVFTKIHPAGSSNVDE